MTLETYDIIYVDDEGQLTSMFESFLGMLFDNKYSVRTFNDPRTLLDELRGGRIAAGLWLIDVMMDGVDGVELADNIRKIYGDAPLVFAYTALQPEVLNSSYAKSSAAFSGVFNKLQPLDAVIRELAQRLDFERFRQSQSASPAQQVRVPSFNELAEEGDAQPAISHPVAPEARLAFQNETSREVHQAAAEPPTPPPPRKQQPTPKPVQASLFDGIVPADSEQIDHTPKQAPAAPPRPQTVKPASAPVQRQDAPPSPLPAPRPARKPAAVPSEKPAMPVQRPVASASRTEKKAPAASVQKAPFPAPVSAAGQSSVTSRRETAPSRSSAPAAPKPKPAPQPAKFRLPVSARELGGKARVSLSGVQPSSLVVEMAGMTGVYSGGHTDAEIIETSDKPSPLDGWDVPIPVPGQRPVNRPSATETMAETPSEVNEPETPGKLRWLKTALISLLFVLMLSGIGVLTYLILFAQK